MYLSRAEACKQLNISRETFRKLIRTGELQAHKIGNGRTSPWRVSEDEITAYIKRRTMRAAS